MSDLDPRWDPWDQTRLVEQVALGEDRLRVGDRVRLHPRGRADILDLELEGRIGLIEAIERDYDDIVHLAVVLEDDPGRDLGLLRQPGHRFFFRPEEVEPVR